MGCHAVTPDFPSGWLWGFCVTGIIFIFIWQQKSIVLWFALTQIKLELDIYIRLKHRENKSADARPSTESHVQWAEKLRGQGAKNCLRQILSEKEWKRKDSFERITVVSHHEMTDAFQFKLLEHNPCTMASTDIPGGSRFFRKDVIWILLNSTSLTNSSPPCISAMLIRLLNSNFGQFKRILLVFFELSGTHLHATAWRFCTYLVGSGLRARSHCTASKKAAFQKRRDCQMGCSFRKLYRKCLNSGWPGLFSATNNTKGVVTHVPPLTLHPHMRRDVWRDAAS